MTLDALNALINGGIEHQEKQGQLAQAQLQTLPRDLGTEMPLFEKLGFVFGDNVDNLFVNVQFPEGWTKKPTEHSMWSDIVDAKGRKRGMIFFKAAFYDRSAHAHLERRFGVSVVNYQADPRQMQVRDACGQVDLKSEPYKGGDYDAQRKVSELLEAWLTSNYPDWQSPLAYWD